MKKLNYLLAIPFLAGAVGCGTDQGNEEAKGVIPEHQLKALDAAKGTEQVLKDAEEARRKALDAQSQGG